MTERVLVCILAKTYAHQLTWPSFKRCLLDELGADLAVCIGVDSQYDYNNPYFQHARYRRVIPDPSDYGAEIDKIALALRCRSDWRQLLVLCDNPYAIFLGGVAGVRGSGAILLFYRWLLHNFIVEERLCERYDRFVITRSDFMYACPHPGVDVLEPGSIWLPDGEDWGGLVDRHMVVSSGDVLASLSALSDLLLNPEQWTDALRLRDPAYRNSEGVLQIHLTRTGLISRIQRFPYIMFLVRGENDPASWAPGEFAREFGCYVKYETELLAARRWRERFRSRADWLAWAGRIRELDR
ncbi:MAG TPA: hypothetical protein VGR45_05795 [Stellaceae bacterium]|nr:hypothetical protein [Stellaceae bacterium]